jgi:hypothetical protein
MEHRDFGLRIAGCGINEQAALRQALGKQAVSWISDLGLGIEPLIDCPWQILELQFINPKSLPAIVRL